MFVLPTVISTIADIITIIDVALKYSGALSKNVRTVIEKSREEITGQENSLSLGDVSTILNNNLKVGISKDDLIPVTKSLSNYFEIIDGTIQHLESFNKNNRMVNYGDIFFNLISRVGEKLDKWGCFNKWAEDVPVTIPKVETPGFHLADYLLLASNLTKTFWEIGEVRSQANPKFKKQNLYYVKSYILNFSDVFHPASIFGIVKITNKTYNRIGGNNQILNYVDVSILSNSISLTYSEPMKMDSIKLSNAAFATLISATLGDFFDYSTRVNKEFEVSNSLVSQLKNQKKAG